MPQQGQRKDLPIGYWLKKTDELLTLHTNKIHSAYNLSRSDWQVLNFIHEAGKATADTIFEVMRVFVSKDQLETIVGRLRERGWVELLDIEGSLCFKLSEQGLTQHQVILSAQQQLRKQLMEGISETEYATVIQTLQRMVHNLEDPEEENVSEK